MIRSRTRDEKSIIYLSLAQASCSMLKLFGGSLSTHNDKRLLKDFMDRGSLDASLFCCFKIHSVNQSYANTSNSGD